MLDALGERVGAVEVSDSYANGLTRDEWAALTVKVERNGISLSIDRHGAA